MLRLSLPSSIASSIRTSSPGLCFQRSSAILFHQHLQGSCWYSSKMQQPRFSSGTDEASAKPIVDSLTSQENGGRWTLASEGEALERSFKFKTFAKTWDFMTAVSLQCKIKNHHPEWSNVYNTTFIRWTTHSPKGLSDKDVSMAQICDALAKDFGEQEPEQTDGNAKALADQVAVSAGDCCVPKKKANN